MNSILPLVLVAVMLAACAAPQEPKPTPTQLAMPLPPTATRTVVRPSPTPLPKRVAKATVPPTPKRVAKATVPPTPSRAQVCGGLRGGLYVIKVEPLTALVWDLERRSFRVTLCNANQGATSSSGELSIFIYVAGAQRPIGQTNVWIGAIPPGYQERIVGDWRPGLENHKSVCVQKSAVELEVVFREDRSAGWFRAVRFPDGHNKTPYPIRCGGDYA